MLFTGAFEHIIIPPLHTLFQNKLCRLCSIYWVGAILILVLTIEYKTGQYFLPVAKPQKSEYGKVNKYNTCTTLSMRGYSPVRTDSRTYVWI